LRRRIFGIIGTTRWAIGGVLLARSMSENEVVICKKLSPTSLATVKDFGGHKSCQILVIRENLDRVA
jgi:hypothetical protein